MCSHAAVKVKFKSLPQKPGSIKFKFKHDQILFSIKRENTKKGFYCCLYS